MPYRKIVELRRGPPICTQEQLVPSQPCSELLGLVGKSSRKHVLSIRGPGRVLINWDSFLNPGTGTWVSPGLTPQCLETGHESRAGPSATQIPSHT